MVDYRAGGTGGTRGGLGGETLGTVGFGILGTGGTLGSGAFGGFGRGGVGKTGLMLLALTSVGAKIAGQHAECRCNGPVLQRLRATTDGEGTRMEIDGNTGDRRSRGWSSNLQDGGVGR